MFEEVAVGVECPVCTEDHVLVIFAVEDGTIVGTDMYSPCGVGNFTKRAINAAIAVARARVLGIALVAA